MYIVERYTTVCADEVEELARASALDQHSTGSRY